MKKLIPLLMICCLLCSGCAATTANPLRNAEATEVPGLAMNAYPATADDSNTESFEATLYFRYLDEPVLASEMRTISIRRDESKEIAVVRALIDGPGAGYGDLQPLIPTSTIVESVSNANGILFLTLNDAFLNDGLERERSSDPSWLTDAQTHRRLAAQSIVSTLTDLTPYLGVQLMVSGSGDAATRLNNDYFLTELGGLSDPLIRDEALLMTPSNAVSALMGACVERDFGHALLYIAHDGISEQDAVQSLDDAPRVAAFEAGNGIVENDRAVVTLKLTLSRDGASHEIAAYPLPLHRSSGVWKVRYQDFLAMLSL